MTPRQGIVYVSHADALTRCHQKVTAYKMTVSEGGKSKTTHLLVSFPANRDGSITNTSDGKLLQVVINISLTNWFALHDQVT